jgi:uncharacterized protein HemX
MIDWGVVFGAVSIVFSLILGAVGYGAMKQKVENMKESKSEYEKAHAQLHEKYEETHAQLHDKEDEKTLEKFKELYDSRNMTALAVERLTTLIEQVFKRLDSIEGKLDKAIEGGK